MKKKLDYGTILIVGMVLSIMKKVKKIFVLLVMVLLVKNVHAECGYETQAKLNSEAATIKAIYEEQIGEFDSSFSCNDGQGECEGYNYFKISIFYYLIWNYSFLSYIVIFQYSSFNIFQ